MCGIVGGVTQRDIGIILLQSLQRLEYRGYDSAGLAIISNENMLQVKRIRGKVNELLAKFEQEPFAGGCGIAHTRWATHGEPSEANAHPHVSNDKVAVVHNGIIENYQELKSTLQAEGYDFTSQTDTEVIAHLIHRELQNTADLLRAVQKAIPLLVGMYAIAVIATNDPSTIVVVRCGSPLVIGLGDTENYIASDSLALLPLTRRFIYLEEGDVARICKEVEVFNSAGEPVERKAHLSSIEAETVNRGSFPHFMLKEIFEQPDDVADTLNGRLGKNHVLAEIFGVKSNDILERVENIMLVACGTSFHAACVAKYWIEELTDISCQIEIASEFRYRHPVVRPNSLFIAISQSGETADTLAAFRQAKQLGYFASLVICNVPESSLVREADLVLLTRAGPEIGVASTKSFTCQLTCLMLLTLVLAHPDKFPEGNDQAQIIHDLRALPGVIERLLEDLNKPLEQLAKRFVMTRNALFLGRGSLFPIALEGALKMKEITYLHAEAYPAGELKHGPLAIVDTHMPVFVLAPSNGLFSKLYSNLEEVRARRGDLIVFADVKNRMESAPGLDVVPMPTVNELLAPIVYTIPLQLLAYHLGVLFGNDVDQPRNLAKSVTVE